MSVRPLRPDISLPLPRSLKTDALQLRNKLLHFRLTSLWSVGALADRKVEGIDPRLNQTALSLLSLIDDAELRNEVAAQLHAKQRQLTADRARTGKARTLRIIAEAFQQKDRARIRLRDIADRVNAAGDELDEPMSPRQVGQVLRTLSVPLRKSNGQIVVEKEDWKL